MGVLDLFKNLGKINIDKKNKLKILVDPKKKAFKVGLEFTHSFDEHTDIQATVISNLNKLDKDLFLGTKLTHKF